MQLTRMHFLLLLCYVYMTLHFYFPCNILHLNDVLERALE